MKKRPSISEDELIQRMDFNRVLAGYHHHQLMTTRVWRFATGAGLVAITALVTYLALPPSAPSVSTPVPETTVPPPATAVDSVATEPAPKVTTAPSGERRKKSQQLPPKVIESLPPAYTPAVPLNGYEDLYNYFQRELRYPELALADSVEGVVMISFFINKQGEPEHVKVEQSLGPLFDEEAVRLVQNMPPWVPARLGTEPTRSKLSLPITFRIEK